MGQLFEYVGTIGVSSDGCRDIILDDVRDWNKAPIRLTVTCPSMAKYLEERGWTDAEERYINAVWYFDRNLFLRRMEIPSTDGLIPAKAFFIDDRTLNMYMFGPDEYIDEVNPAPMSQYDWRQYREFCHGTMTARDDT